MFLLGCILYPVIALATVFAAYMYSRIKQLKPSLHNFFYIFNILFSLCMLLCHCLL
jgi:hypothetical protein